MEKLYTFDEVQKILQVHPNTLYGYLQSGKLNGVKLGGDKIWRVKESDLESFIEGDQQ